MCEENYIITQQNSNTYKMNEISGTTNISGAIYTSLRDSYNIVSASSQGHMAIPFVGGSGVWGIAFYTVGANGLVPEANIEVDCQITYFTVS